MKSLFTKTFFKLAFGFAGIILVGIIGIFVIGYGFEQSGNNATIETNAGSSE